MSILLAKPHLKSCMDAVHSGKAVGALGRALHMHFHTPAVLCTVLGTPVQGTYGDQ